MSLKDTLKKQLTPELFTQVVDLLGDDFDYDVVPRTRLNKVIGQRNDLKKALAEAAAQPNPKGNADDDDDDDDDDNGLSDKKGGAQRLFSQKDVDKRLAELEAKHATEIDTMRKENVVLNKLRAKGATDPETILKAGLVDLSKLTFEQDGTLKGVDDVVDSLVKDKAYFFNTSGGDHQRGTGKGGTDDDQGSSELDSKLDAIFGRYNPTGAEE